ncbi:MAG: ImmA/IrrE family metallo-endopeptidase [Cyanobacteria bacterium J06560_5]
MSLIEKLPAKFRQRCEAISTQQRSILGLRAFDALPARMLAKHLNAHIFTPSDLPSLDRLQLLKLVKSEQWSAIIIRQNPLWIAHNPEHSAARQESNLMHELAHILLEHRSITLNASDGSSTREDKREEEATFLGGCLQIPKRGLLWAKQSNLTKVQIADHFLASQEMVSFRCAVTGVKLS